MTTFERFRPLKEETPGGEQKDLTWAGLERKRATSCALSVANGTMGDWVHCTEWGDGRLEALDLEVSPTGAISFLSNKHYTCEPHPRSYGRPQLICIANPFGNGKAPAS